LKKTAVLMILLFTVVMSAQEVSYKVNKIYNEKGKLVKTENVYTMTTDAFFTPVECPEFNVSFYLSTNIDTNRVKADDKIVLLNDLYEVLAEDGVVRPTNHINIFVFSRITNYAEVIEKILGSEVSKKIWGRPLTFLPVNGLSLLVPPGFFRMPEDFAYLFPHEFAHYFIQRVEEIPYHNTMYWLLEGHADETQFRVLGKLYPDKYPYTNNLAVALAQVLKVYQFTKKFPTEETFLYFGVTDYYTYMTHYIYNLSFLAVDYINNKYGPEKKMALIRDMMVYSPEENILTNLGIEYSDFYADFREYILSFDKKHDFVKIPSDLFILEKMDQLKNGDLDAKAVKMGMDKGKFYFDIHFTGGLWGVGANQNMRFEVSLTSGEQEYRFKFDSNYGVTASITMTNKDKNLGTYYNSLVPSDYIVYNERVFGWIDNVFGFDGLKVDKVKIEVFAHKNYKEKAVYTLECFPKPLAKQ